MDELIRDHPVKVFTLIGIVVSTIIWLLYQLGWIKSRKAQPWDGVDRRSNTCADHPQMTSKVCALYSKLDDLEKKSESLERKLDMVVEKTDTAARKVEYILGLIEARWGKLRGTDRIE